MTIDEAIVECKQNDLYQYAEWLEQLKIYKSSKFNENIQTLAYRQGYNKAIDDFKKELFKNSERARPAGWSRYSEIVTCEKIYDIAEQLKVGGKND